MVPSFLKISITIVIVVVGVYAYLANTVPTVEREEVIYGVTFSVHRAEEYNIPWRETYDALLDDLGVQYFRLVAHWDLIEPAEGQYNFSELDYQIRRAEEEGAQVVLAVGRRLPSWPECHEPDWIQQYSFDEQKGHIRNLITEVVNRYKDSPALRMWQVENEPFIIGFALGECGALDIEFLEEEVALVNKLDPEHPVMLTASGELGFWNNTWSRANVFGTTLYRVVWNRDLNSYVSYPTSPGFYRAKARLTELTTGESKSTVLAELAAEPWLPEATINFSLEEQLERMNIPQLEGDLVFAAQAGFGEQYLWGAEWWYYLKEVHGYDAFWEWTRRLFDEE